MSNYGLIEIGDAEWDALHQGVLVGLTIMPEDAVVQQGDLIDVWCESMSCVIRMACLVVEEVDKHLYILQTASRVMEAVA